ncbi:hypothetical protein PF007_g24347 [Phytophthora fragariae]|uniref:Ankyrin repeat protein n=1 Tax=Phytophthora fragariae TaxID=53985 RepID=A0A6A3QIF6_9STRA|nr:hypothetical protein PF007_g24347 [Phytophthora fragariae]
MHRALTIVAFVLRHQADADALQELNEVVSNFIGPDPNLSLAAACSLGSTRLLNWIWNASAASKEERTSRWTLGNYLRSEPKYHQWQFQKAVGWQSQEGNAASSGRLEILKFLLEHDAGRNCTHMRVKTPIGGENVVHWSSRSIVNAIEKGHKDIAKWLYQQVPHESSTDDIQMIVESSLAAGYIDLANLVLPPDRNILECAPFCPRPEIVEMALETAYFPLNKRCAVASIQNLARVGRLDLVQRIVQLFSPLLSPAAIDFDWTSCWYRSIKEACTRGDLAMVQWLLDHPVGRALCAEMKHNVSVNHFLPITAEADQVEVMQYLYQEEIAGQYTDALIRAVRNGHLNATKWLLQHHSYLGRVAIDSVIDEAAKNGHLEILKFFGIWIYLDKRQMHGGLDRAKR